MSQKNQQNASEDQTLNYFVFYTIFFGLGRLVYEFKHSLSGLLIAVTKRSENSSFKIKRELVTKGRHLSEPSDSIHSMYGDETEDISPDMTIQYEDWLAVLIPERVDSFREKSLAMTHYHHFINQ